MKCKRGKCPRRTVSQRVYWKVSGGHNSRQREVTEDFPCFKFEFGMIYEQHCEKTSSSIWASAQSEQHIYTPAKRSFRGVYCFQSVRNPEILKFCHSVHISKFLMYNLSSFCPILFKFSTHFNH